MSNFLSQRWLLSRRHFLRGVGHERGPPLAQCHDAARRRRSGRQAAPLRVRLHSQRRQRDDLASDQGRAATTNSRPSLRPLEKHRQQFTIFSGLHHPNGLGQAHVCADTWLTGAKIDAQSARQYHNTVSCDQLMAEVTSRDTRFASLELSIASGTGQPNNSSTLAFSRDGVPLPAEDNPRNVFDRLFGEEPGGIGHSAYEPQQAPQRARCGARRRKIVEPRPGLGRPHQAR